MGSHPLRLRCVCNPSEHCAFPMCNSKEYHIFQKSTMYFSCAAIPSDSGACATYKSTVYFPCATQKSTIYFKRALCTSHVQTPPPTQGCVQLKRALCISHVQKSTIHFPRALKIGIYSQRALYSSRGSHVQKITIHLKRALCSSHVQLKRVPCISKEHSIVPVRNSKKTCI